jgi:hypothetical protein
MFHYFDQFLAEYESRFEREYGFFRPIIKEVVERYLDCGNPKCGFARIRIFFMIPFFAQKERCGCAPAFFIVSAACEPLWPTRRDFRCPLTSYFVMIYIS